MTYSAAYGLLLNLAGLEMRAPDNGKSTMTLIADELPALELALGLLGSMPGSSGFTNSCTTTPLAPPDRSMLLRPTAANTT